MPNNEYSPDPLDMMMPYATETAYAEWIAAEKEAASEDTPESHAAVWAAWREMYREAMGYYPSPYHFSPSSHRCERYSPGDALDIPF